MSPNVVKTVTELFNSDSRKNTFIFIDLLKFGMICPILNVITLKIIYFERQLDSEQVS